MTGAVQARPRAAKGIVFDSSPRVAVYLCTNNSGRQGPDALPHATDAGRRLRRDGARRRVTGGGGDRLVSCTRRSGDGRGDPRRDAPAGVPGDHARGRGLAHRGRHALERHPPRRPAARLRWPEGRRARGRVGADPERRHHRREPLQRLARRRWGAALAGAGRLGGTRVARGAARAAAGPLPDRGAQDRAATGRAGLGSACARCGGAGRRS